ncbi:MAG: DUF1501 domain-containing protein, partial [Acidobacteriota bacterium]|nr:DUF1501 domain-containing protein [Acidobacteriota bacterium]
MIRKPSRREWISSLSGGLGIVGLAGMFSDDAFAAAKAAAKGAPKVPVAPPRITFPNFPPRAKSNIVLFLRGGPSQLDMFDPKP